MQARFSQRVFAYFIDVLLISLFVGMITGLFPQSKTVTKLYEEQNEIIEKYSAQEISSETYINQSMDLNYDIAKQTALFSIVHIFISILYFCVFPYYQNGQTLGKKALKIKIVKENQSKLTMNDLIIRSLLVESILLNILLTFLSLVGTKDIYIWGAGILDGAQYIFLIISVILVAFSKEKQGLHDKIVKTQVVCVDTKIKEMEDAKCES